jgi:hypothetical protein
MNLSTHGSELAGAKMALFACDRHIDAKRVSG